MLDKDQGQCKPTIYPRTESYVSPTAGASFVFKLWLEESCAVRNQKHLGVI